MTKNKSLKPISLDAQFKYKCTNVDCEAEHWLFLNQVKVKNFKLVCDCGIVYKIRRIENIKPVYIKKSKQPTIVNETQTVESNTRYLDKAYRILEHYGFSKKEAVDLIDKVHNITECNDPLILVKDAMKIFGGM
jgi:hypothetical protein